MPASRPPRRPFALACEPLEARVVLTTTTTLDPAFGSRGVVLGATSPADINLSNATAVAVQADGKIVEVGPVGTGISSQNFAIAARRYNADGSVDTSFGTNGQVFIPSAATAGRFANAPGNVEIGTDGSIVFAAVAQAALASAPVGTIPPANSIVVRLTPAGQLDPSFGTGGEVVLGPEAGSLTRVVLRGGSIVAAGTVLGSIGDNGGYAQSFSVVRLTAAGGFDTTFNATGRASLTIPSFGLNGATTDTLSALELTPTGEILLGGTTVALFSFENSRPILAEIRADGTPDPAFGADGFADLTSSRLNSLGGVAVRPDGSIVVAGTRLSSSPAFDLVRSTALVQLTKTGAVDPAFATTIAANAAGQVVDSVVLGTDGAITVGGTATIGISTYPFVARYRADGTIDPDFGLGGRTLLNFRPTFSAGSPITSLPYLNDLVLANDGAILAVGQAVNYARGANPGQIGPNQGNQAFLARVLPIKTAAVENDYDGDGKADLAAILGALGLYASRPSSGAPDVLAPFGPTAVGGAIPAPGDYDGDGKADVAAYLPELAILAYRPSSGGADVLVTFGAPGAGQSVPAPGDYDGDGKTDVAVYLPGPGVLAYRPSGGGADVLVQFGAGAGQSVAAPGDYDGDGKADVAVYLPGPGVLAYRPSSGGADVLAQFGAGANGSVPAPGDYDGDGRTDIAVYLPAFGAYAYRPSGGGGDVIAPFGFAGAGQSIPAPGDYDGDGRTDLAVYLPSIGYFGTRPSGGGVDTLSPFGGTGPGQTVPASSIPAAFAAPAAADTGAVRALAVRDLALTDDLITPELARLRRKRKSAT